MRFENVCANSIDACMRQSSSSLPETLCGDARGRKSRMHSTMTERETTQLIVARDESHGIEVVRSHARKTGKRVDGVMR
jgi:hypothetical protein